jgi:hypothetical protein
VSGASRQIEIGYGNDQLFQFASGTVQKAGVELWASDFKPSGTRSLAGRSQRCLFSRHEIIGSEETFELRDL